jgi:hypothetical protein
MAVSAAAQIITSPVSTTALILKRQDIQLVLDAINAAFTVISIYGLHRLGYPPLTVVMIYSILNAVMYGIYYLTYMRLVRGLASPKTLVPHDLEAIR